MVSYNLVNWYKIFGGTYNPHTDGGLRGRVCLKPQYAFTRLHGVASEKNVLIACTAERTSHLRLLLLRSCR